MSSNPNNCETCKYTHLNDDPALHCYMFKDEPEDVCNLHSGRGIFSQAGTNRDLIRGLGVFNVVGHLDDAGLFPIPKENKDEDDNTRGGNASNLDGAGS
jgi:hypothetical protein